MLGTLVGMYSMSSVARVCPCLCLCLCLSVPCAWLVLWLAHVYGGGGHGHGHGDALVPFVHMAQSTVRVRYSVQAGWGPPSRDLPRDLLCYPYLPYCLLPCLWGKNQREKEEVESDCQAAVSSAASLSGISAPPGQ
jgi:hypothetical protein